MFASLSIYGLYCYDSTIFDNLVLPADFTDGERNDTIMTILAECSDLALLYPDWDFMKMLIGVWSKNELLIWTKMLQSERIEYNPIENYDRHETLTRSIQSSSGEEDSRQSATTGQGSRKDSSQSASTGQGSRKDSSQSGSTNLESRKDSSQSGSSTGTAGSTQGMTGQTAYDSDTIKDTGRSTGESQSSTMTANTGSGESQSNTMSADTSTGESQSSTMTADSRNGESAERSASQTAESGQRKTNSHGVETVTNHTHGNIGVTQAADMLERYRQVSDFCTIDFIVHSFRDRFCIQVY